MRLSEKHFAAFAAKGFSGQPLQNIFLRRKPQKNCFWHNDSIDLDEVCF
jgi:hypothetical protein